MSLFISSNSTKALIAKTDSLEKKVNELGEQKKSNNSFIKKIKSFRNSSAKAVIRKKLKMESLKTLEKELGKAEALKDKLYKHYLNLSEKKFKKEDKNGGKDTLNQFLGDTKKDALDASEQRLLKKIDSDLNKATKSLDLCNKTYHTMTKLDDKIQSMECRIVKVNSIKELEQVIKKRQQSSYF